MYEHFKHDSKNIFLVSMQQEPHPFFSDLMLRGCRKMLKQKKRILIFASKKGFDTGVLCTSCGHIPLCTYCDVPISYHKMQKESDENEKKTTKTHPATTTGLEFYPKTVVGLCRICKTQYDFPTVCPQCGKATIKPYGLGIQKAKELLYQYLMPEVAQQEILEITAEKVNSLAKVKKLTATLDAYSIIIATSILTHPPANRTPDLIVILQAETGLSIPDFTAPRKNFWFLYEIFTKYQTPHFIVQTYAPTQPSIRYACKLDMQGFLEYDNAFREKHLYPPYGDICVLLYKHEIEKHLHAKIDTVYRELLFLQQKYNRLDISIYTTPPLVYKMFGKYRYHIILKGKNLRPFLDIVVSKLDLIKRGFKLDRQAQGIV